jgi:hypothetical protein
MGVAGHQNNLQLAAGLRLPLTPRVGLSLMTAGRYANEPQARDSLLTVPVRVLNKPGLVWTVSPGASLPTGTLGAAGDFTPLSTGSVDPWLASAVVAGSGWLFTGMGQVRPTLYAGRDDVTQGHYWRGDVGVARRLNDHVVRVGVSSAGVTDDFTELAIAAGGVINLNEQWGLAPWVRVPLTDEAYNVAGGLSFTWVRPAPEEEEHHPGDGHEH